MTDHTPRIIALPLDTLDRTTARYRLQDDDYAVATELTMSRADYEGLGRPTLLYATLSGEVPQLPNLGHADACLADGHPHGFDCAPSCPTCHGEGVES